MEQGGVHYVKRNFLGGREATTTIRANHEVISWCNTTAGMRIHGTTKEQPLVRFQTVEQARLQPLAQTPYDMAIWKKAKLSRDCYLTFDHAYYSAPHRLIGQQLWVSGGIQTVRIYTLDHQLVATHDRAQHPGQRCTHLYHLPHGRRAWPAVHARRGGTDGLGNPIPLYHPHDRSLGRWPDLAGKAAEHANHLRAMPRAALPGTVSIDR